MQALLNTAVKAARKGGDLALRYLNRVGDIEVRSKARNEFVTQVDHAAEAAIIDSIRERYPHHAILAEESGSHPGEEFSWIIDPLDGTTNFIHGFPVFSVSIAVKVRDQLEVGVVYDPCRQELYTATRGGGAQLDGRRIRVSAWPGLEGALIGTGFPYRMFDHIDTYLAIFREVAQKTAGMRRPGAAALDLAWVACGRMDGFWELGLSPWDMAAGSLLITEAGGLVGDLSGEANYMKTGNIIGGNPKIFSQLLQLITPHLTAKLKA